MTKTKAIGYALAGIVGVGGITTAFLTFDANAVLASVSANVGMVGLMGALYQLLRDEAAHQKSVSLQSIDHQFQVGATSHMANTVFDKHVLFCEAYIKEVVATMVTLFREHASEKAVEHANNLYTLRVLHSPWVTAQMSSELESFEQDLRTLGARAGFIAHTTGDARYAEERAKAIKFVYDEFDVIMAHLMNKEEVDGKSIQTLITRVQEMLGIEKLVELRTKLIERAHKALTQ